MEYDYVLVSWEHWVNAAKRFLHRRRRIGSALGRIWDKRNLGHEVGEAYGCRHGQVDNDKHLTRFSVLMESGKLWKADVEDSLFFHAAGLGSFP